MYTQIWNKYLPVIKILIKKSATTEQTLHLNQTDFERAGKGRKAGYKFNIAFANGRVSNNTRLSEVGQALINILMSDELFKDLVLRNNYEFDFNTKFQLRIKNCGHRETVLNE
jgi:hypothetical protein